MEVTHWAGRAGFRPTASVLRLPQDVLLEISCLLDVPALLALRQVCRLLSTLTREPVIFIRLLSSSRIPALPRPVPAHLAPSPEHRVTHACRLHKNWDLAALPVTVRTARTQAAPKRLALPRAPPPPKRVTPPAEVLAAPLPYHLPPGADAYPFLKLETYAPFRDSAAKSKPSFGPGPFSHSDPAFANSQLFNRPVRNVVPQQQQPGPAPIQNTAASLQPGPPVSTLPADSSVPPSSQSQSHSTPHESQIPAQPLPMFHPSVPPHCGNFVATTIRAWHVYPPAPTDQSNSLASSSTSDLTIPGAVQPSSFNLHPNLAPNLTAPSATSSMSSRSFTPGPIRGSMPTPPPAPAPRPTRVTSVSVRAILAKVVSGGRWGVFVVKRAPGGSGTGSDAAGRDKGKQKADSLPLTAEALAHLSQAGVVDRKGKGKAKEVPVIADWAGETSGAGGTSITASGSGNGAGTGAAETGKGAPKNDGETFLVVYDLDAADGAFEKGRMAECPIKWTPAGMACRATREGVVIVLISGMTDGAAQTMILRWPYMASSLTRLEAHKSKCPLGAISIQEYENEGRTLAAIIHRPRTVMIQDVDSKQRGFVKLSKVPPAHTVQAIHLLPGPRLLVLRKLQAQDPDDQAFILEEYDVPPMGENKGESKGGGENKGESKGASMHPAGPSQRQWIRGMDLHGCMFSEGPTYENGALPDIALWAFSTLPTRAVVHWILKPGPKTGIGTSRSPSPDPTTDDGPDLPVAPFEKEIYSEDVNTAYGFPAQRVSTSKLSFPHHKATLAPGARRAMWFERPERSRTGEARGMRGVWGYTSVEPYHEVGVDKEGVIGASGKEKGGPVVRNCTGELPEEVLSAMESNTLGVAFDECSGRALVLTCGDGYGAASGCRIWVLDYA